MATIARCTSGEIAVERDRDPRRAGRMQIRDEAAGAVVHQRIGGEDACVRPRVRRGHVAEREEDERGAGDRQDKQPGDQPDDDLTRPRPFTCGGEGHAEAAVPDQPLASPRSAFTASGFGRRG